MKQEGITQKATIYGGYFKTIFFINVVLANNFNPDPEAQLFIAYRNLARSA
jgi:hypothetical protein